MKIIKTAQVAAGPTAPTPSLSGTPQQQTMNMDSPVLQQIGQNNPVLHQIVMVMTQLGNLNIAMIQTDQDKLMATQLAQQLKLVASQLERAAKQNSISAPQPV